MIPVISTAEEIIKQINSTGQGLIGKLTKTDIISVAGNGVKGVLDNLGNLVAVVPLAGGATAYLFGQGGKAVKIVTTKADGVIKSTGEVANSVLQGASDLIVLTLASGKGVVNKLTGVKLGGRRRRRRKSKRRKSRKSKKRRKRKTKRRRRGRSKTRRHRRR